MANGITDFARAGQELATQIGWGTIWTRPGLELKQRSLITVSILAARGKLTELRLLLPKVKQTKELATFRELFLQVMVYCGAPVGMESFRTADAAIKEWKAEHA